MNYTIARFLGQVGAGLFLILLFVAYVRAAKSGQEAQKMQQKKLL